MTTKTKTAWRTVRLGDVARLATAQVNPQLLGDTLVDHFSIPAFDAGKQPVREAANGIQSNKFRVPQGAVLLSKLNPATPRVWKPQTTSGVDAIASTEFLVLTPQNVDRDYLYYQLQNKSFGAQLAGQAGGTSTSHQRVRPAAVLDVDIKVPSDEDVQKEIAKILSAFDEKIENNNRIIKTLEEMAQAIFKEWFVSFRFPGYEKADFIASPLGHTPKGWEVKQLGDATDVTIGRTPPREQSHWFCKNGGVKWLSIKDMGDDSVYIFNTAEQLTKEAVAKFNIQTIPANTVVLSFKLTLGRVAITTEEMVSNEAIAHLRLPKSADLFPEYLYLFIRTINLADFGSTSSIGTAVNSKTVRHVPVLVPDARVLAQARGLLEPIFFEIKSKLSENKKLAAMRDLILPRLMSGEIRV